MNTFEDVKFIILKEYSLNEYESILETIKNLTKNQNYLISKEFWNNSSKNLRKKVITNFKIYLEQINYCDKDEVILTDNSLELLSNLEYDYLSMNGKANSFTKKELKEAIHHWLRIGDYYLSSGHIDWLKRNNTSINCDRSI